MRAQTDQQASVPLGIGVLGLERSMKWVCRENERWEISCVTDVLMGEGGKVRKEGKLDGEDCAKALATRPSAGGWKTGMERQRKRRRKRRRMRRLRRIGERDKTRNSSWSGGRVRNV